MDKLTKYRQYIQEFLTEQCQGKSIGGDIDSETVFDLNQDRYLLIDLGWNKHRRIYNCIIHLEIKKGKILIQRNQTDILITDELINKGVNKNDIIVGTQPPYLREYLEMSK